MGSNEEYLDNLLKAMGNEGEELPDEKVSPDTIISSEEAVFPDETAGFYTVESTLNLSEDEIEQMLAASKQQADDIGTEESAFMEESGSENDDLLALLGSLSDDKEISEIGDLLDKSDRNELVDEGIISVWDADQGFESDELGIGPDADENVGAVDKKEERKQMRLEMKQKKQQEKQQQKEEKLRLKEEKRKQKEEQKQQREAEKKAAKQAAHKEEQKQAVQPVFEDAQEEAIGLFEAVESADVTDIFGAQASDIAAKSDISSLLAELDVEAEGVQEETFDANAFGTAEDNEVVNLFGATESAEVVNLFGGTESDEVVDLFGNAGTDKVVDIFGAADATVDLGNYGEQDAPAVDFGESLNADEKEKGEKKKGFFSKLMTMLTEEDEIEDTLSDENKAIMDELDAEDKAEAKKKKGKKGKPGKKKGKDAQDVDDDEEDEMGKGKGTKEKKKPKKVKPKKEKPKKEKPQIYEAPTRRISSKSIFVVILFAATVFAVIYFAVNFISEMLQINSAKAAFEKMDYVTCYEKMYGMNLSEEEEIMFKHAEIVLKMQRRIAVYEKYLDDDKELEALDSLMRAVAGYEEMYITAQNYNAGAEVHALYMDVLEILENNYGLGQEDAIAIATCESNVQYTRYLTALVEGETVSTGENASGGIVLPEEEEQDILPAEEELSPQDFAD